MRFYQKPTLDAWLTHHLDAINTLLEAFPEIKTLIQESNLPWQKQREMYFIVFHLHKNGFIDNEAKDTSTIAIIDALKELFTHYANPSRHQKPLSLLRGCLQLMEDHAALNIHNVNALLKLTPMRLFHTNKIIHRLEQEGKLGPSNFQHYVSTLLKRYSGQQILDIIFNVDKAFAPSLTTTYWDFIFSSALFDKENLFLLNTLLETLRLYDELAEEHVHDLFKKLRINFDKEMEVPLSEEDKTLPPDAISLTAMKYALLECLKLFNVSQETVENSYQQYLHDQKRASEREATDAAAPTQNERSSPKPT